MNPFDDLPRLTGSCNMNFKKYKNPALKALHLTITDEVHKEDSIDKVISGSKQSIKQKQNNILADDSEKTEHEILAENIRDMKRKRLVEEKNRQRIRESSIELRALEQKIRSAYSYKALEAQKHERSLEANKEKALRLQEDEILLKARITYAENERHQEEEEFKKKTAFREDLRDQMKNNVQARARIYSEYTDEKKYLDEILKKNYDEQLKEMQLKVDKKKRLKAEMYECLEILEQKKNEYVSNDAEERAEAEKIQRELDERLRLQKEKKSLKLKKRAEVSEFIGKKVIEIANEKQKKYDELEDLLIQEQKAREDQKARDRQEADIKLRFQLQQEAQFCKSQSNQKRLDEQMEDKRYREFLDQQLAEKDRLDKIKNDKKRAGQLQVRQDLLRAFEEKKQRRAEEMTFNIRQYEQDMKDEKLNQQLIEEERIKILKEHLPNLIGYLPPGTLRDGDIQILKSIQKQQHENCKIEST